MAKPLTIETTPNRDDLAIVLTGGGARAAYQVGVLRALGRHLPQLRFSIITGVSAGAINATFLAANPESTGQAAVELSSFWEAIRFDDVFRVDLPWLAGNAGRWLLRLAFGGRSMGRKLETRGLLDTEPLRNLLQRVFKSGDSIPGIAHNLEHGRLKALALATVNYGTGQTIHWVQGRDISAWERPHRRGHTAQISVEHIMASSALPLLFPAVQLDKGWFGDGGIRMEAPLSPALHLGANRVLAISTRYPRNQKEADSTSVSGYPPPAQIIGNLLNAIFLDVLDRDVNRLQRLNDLLARAPSEHHGTLRPVEVLVLRPSQDLGRLSARYEPQLPKAFRFLTRGLGTRQTKSPDFLSLLMFQPDYIQCLIDIGERDAEKHFDAIRALVAPET